MSSTIPITSFFVPKSSAKKKGEGKAKVHRELENVRPKKKRKVETTLAEELSSTSSEKSTQRISRGEKEDADSGSDNVMPGSSRAIAGPGNMDTPNHSRIQLANRTKSLNKAGFNVASPSLSSNAVQAVTGPYITPKSLAKPAVSGVYGNRRADGTPVPAIDLTSESKSRRHSSLEEPDENPFIASPQVQARPGPRPRPRPISLSTRTSVLPLTPPSLLRDTQKPFPSAPSPPSSSNTTPTNPIRATLNQPTIPTWTPKRSSKGATNHPDIVPETPETPSDLSTSTDEKIADLSPVPSSHTQEVEIDLSPFRRRLPSAALDDVGASSQDIVPSSQSQDIDRLLFDIISPRRKLAAKEIFENKRISATHDSIGNQVSEGISRQTSVALDEVVPSSQSLIEFDLFEHFSTIRRTREGPESTLESQIIIPSSQSQFEDDLLLLGQKGLLDSISPRRKRVAREIEEARRVAQDAEKEAVAKIDVPESEMGKNDDENLDDIVLSSQSQIELSEYLRGAKVGSSRLGNSIVGGDGINELRIDVSIHSSPSPSASKSSKWARAEVDSHSPTTSDSGSKSERFSQKSGRTAPNTLVDRLITDEDMQSLFVHEDEGGPDESLGEALRKEGGLKEREESRYGEGARRNLFEIDRNLGDDRMARTDLQSKKPPCNSQDSVTEDSSGDEQWSQQAHKDPLTYHAASSSLQRDGRCSPSPSRAEDVSELLESPSQHIPASQPSPQESYHLGDDKTTRTDLKSKKRSCNSQDSVTEDSSGDEQWMQQDRKDPLTYHAASSSLQRDGRCLPSPSRVEDVSEFLESRSQHIPSQHIPTSRPSQHSQDHSQSQSRSHPQRSQETQGTQSWQTDVSAYSYPPEALDFLSMLEEGPD
ncbi:hypothetical protein GYMLUDRAFT_240056 [Collybiopsis luxurians FD-317 M1]|nr:hypothetical protein GYMLUDRAFT_240056 [Collybiopsis luxurians FD-317 M1]